MTGSITEATRHTASSWRTTSAAAVMLCLMVALGSCGSDTNGSASTAAATSKGGPTTPAKTGGYPGGPTSGDCDLIKLADLNAITEVVAKDVTDKMRGTNDQLFAQLPVSNDEHAWLRSEDDCTFSYHYTDAQGGDRAGTFGVAAYRAGGPKHVNLRLSLAPAACTRQEASSQWDRAVFVTCPSDGGATVNDRNFDLIVVDGDQLVRVGSQVGLDAVANDVRKQRQIEIAVEVFKRIS